MKTLIISLLLSISTSAMAQVHKHVHSEHSKQNVLNSSDLKLLKMILKKNDDLFNSLLKDNQADVAKYADLLSTDLKDANSIDLRTLKLSSATLLKISKANTKEQNLKMYEEFIPSLVELVKKYRPDSNFQIYYCPMVKKNWLQDQRTNSSVKNVFAQDMLECGGKES